MKCRKRPQSNFKKGYPHKREKESLSLVLPARVSYEWCTPLSQLKGKLWAAASSMGSGGCLLQLGSSSFRKDWQRWSCQPLPLDPESLLPASASTQTLKDSIWPRRWGLPFPASKLLSRFKGVFPWTGKSSLSEKSIKASSCVSGSAKQPCNTPTHTYTFMLTHSIWHQKVLGAAQLQPQT